jgi:predicted Ser/Thr protein kinase
VQPPPIEVIRELKNDAFARTWLVRMDGRYWLRKEFRFRIPLGRLLTPLARRWARHEMEVGRVLAGIDGLPGVPVPLSETVFCRPWIEGRDLRHHLRAGGKLSDRFFDDLLAVVEQVHRRGVAYADLQKRDNIIVGSDGRPYLVDFQISHLPYRGRSALRRAVSEWWLRHSQADDLRHVYKHKRRLRPGLATPEERLLSERRSPVSWLKRIVYARTLRPVKRLGYPKGSNETFRLSKAWRQRRRR